MTDHDLLDRFGPAPTHLSDTALGAARARLDGAMTQAPPAKHRPRRRLALLAAAAVAAVGLTVTPTFVGSDDSVALAAVDPLTFPFKPTALPTGLGDPIFERDTHFIAARYGSALNGVSIVTDVEDENFWIIPDDAPTAEINGHSATLVRRTVHNGTTESAPAVAVIWRSDDNDWTAVTGSGSYADADRVQGIAESLREEAQPVDLALTVAPAGWSVVAYKEDRILTLSSSGEAGRSDLTVHLMDHPSEDLSAYGVQQVSTVTINGEPAVVGRREAEQGGLSWVLEAQTAGGQAFSLQAGKDLTRDQVIEIGEGVTYRP